ncbi:dTDP-4-dehydrorhamnose reductase [Altererythrobacter sp. TH136]|uniref:dTDP-4-dehydrorhamnose reductase n=1 Tax=Altererythrobacter sp. TH136 TaxID=2067415 RepID=UPI0011631F77|nr:dTDP-4-dehydrorhamnose reductase [Altererythrobacter sp. TH136]QDM41006.1 dTDP-4-dehydrorhamnose reductase [Altererythrobacter sp. TH136]
MGRPILVTGAGGQLGRELQRCVAPDGFEVVALGRDALDLADTDAIGEAVASQDWAAIINAGAYTAVDAAEEDMITAWAVNALAPAALARSCAARGIPLVQVSTDYVFCGEGRDAWQVDDPTRPLGVYGASKLGGELAVRTGGVRHAIVRTAWVVSPHGKNFVKTMLRLATEHDSVRVVDDQIGSPTSAADLAEAVLAVAARMATQPDAPDGTFHFCNAGSTSWAGFAAEIFRQSASRGGPSATVEPISTTDYPTAARRPANSVLSTQRIERDYGMVPRSWQIALNDILDELIGVKT